MATIAALATRLRTELGDFGRSFVYQITADGTTNRFLVPYAPLDGVGLVVTKNGTDVSLATSVEEATGFVVFDVLPTTGAVLIFSGNYFKYFINDEINTFVTEAFRQHSNNHTDAYGRAVSLETLPTVEEYPVSILATALALYTLATDASFDIDISAPDGVTIPRSERFRQVMAMVESRREQYRELCNMLGIGLYKIDVFNLRRISLTTNRYPPIYAPMEVDDRTMPVRVSLPMPTYGSLPKPTTEVVKDLYVIAGDSYSFQIQFAFDLTNYTAAAQIRDNPGSMVLSANFILTTPLVSGISGYKTLQLALTPTQTTGLPSVAAWDVQLKDSQGNTTTYAGGKVFVTPQVTIV